MSGGTDAEREPLIPARILNEWTYCPRLAMLEWVHGEWAASADTVDGESKHRRADKPGPDAPADGELESGFVTRSLWLSSPSEGITGRLDVAEEQQGELIPVDTKRGEAPDVPFGVWDADRIQIAAQAMVLRDHGYRCSRGYVYYAGSKRRVEVPVDDELVGRVRQAVLEIRAAASSTELPPPLVDSPKCPRCSLVGICLPDEARVLASATADEARQLAAPRYEGLPLYVTEQGATIGAQEGEFVVSKARAELARARTRDTSHIAVFGNIQLTANAMRIAMDDQIPVTFFSYGGYFRGTAQGLGHRNVVLRLAQFRTSEDAARSLAIAQAIVRGKIRNQRTLVRRNHPGDAAAALDALARLSEQAATAASLDVLLGVEGEAARTYFSCWPELLHGRGDQGAPGFEWISRNRRPPRDPINAMLSFAYSLLTKDCLVAAQSVGFDPYLGFYHAPRYGKPALALDLMEEMRPLIADSVVLSAVNQGEVDEASFVRRADGCNLTDSGRRAFLHAYERRMDALVTHPTFGYRLSWRRVLELQARILAKTCLGEVDHYVPMETR